MAVTTRRVALPRGVDLFLRELGEGESATLLIHGWAVPGTVWDPVLERWPAEAGRVLVPDLRGTGWSSKPREGYALDDDVADVLALIDAIDGLAPGSLNLVGHSKGGLIAQRVAIERPQALRKLVLVSPVPAAGVALDEATIGFFESLCGHREGAEQLISMMLATPAAPERLSALVDSMASVAIESLLGGFAAWRSASFADRLSAISTPTVVISGGAEQVLSPALMQEQVVAPIRGATLRLLEGVGHYPQIESPEGFTAALLEALN